jgi:hypothetical protein
VSEIVCLVRGGEAGRNTQEQAIEYARGTGKKLVFLHIINPAGLVLDNEKMLEPVLQEQTWLARVSLSQARQRAERRGMKADMTIRKGAFVETVEAYVEEKSVERVYLGMPRKEGPDYEMRLERVHSFARRLEENLNVEVAIV